MASLLAIFKAQDKISGSLKGINNQSGAVTAGFKKLAGAAAAAFSIKKVADFGISCSKAATTLESGMAEVFTLLPGITEDAMGDMTAQVREFAKETGTLTEDTVPALYSALSAGVPQDNVFSFLESANKLAVGGVASLDDSVATLATITNNYKKDGLEASTASDMLFTTVKNGVTTISELSANLGNVVPSAASAGVGFDQVSAAMATMTASLGAGSTAVASTKLRSMFDELSKTGSNVDKTFRQIAGKSFTEFTASGGTTQEALQKLNKYADESNLSIKELFNSTEAGTAALILGSSAADSFSKNMDAMTESAGATDTAYATMEDTVTHKLDLLKAKFEDVKLGIGGALNGVFSDFLDGALDAADGATTAFEEFSSYLSGSDLGKALGDYFSGNGSVDSISTALDSAKDTVINTISSMFGDGIAAASDVMLTRAKDTFTGVLKIFSGDASGIFDIGSAMGIDKDTITGALSVFETVKGTITNVITAIWPVIDSLYGAWAKMWPVMVSVVNSAIQNVLPVIQNVISFASEHVIPVVRDIASFIADTVVPMVTSAIQELAPKVSAFVSAVASAANSIFNAIKPVLEAIFAAWQKTFPVMKVIFVSVFTVIKTAVGVIIDLFTGIITFIDGVFSGSWEKIWTGIGQTFENIFKGIAVFFEGIFVTLGSLLASFGASISAGWTVLWSGIKTVFSTLWRAVVGIFMGPIIAIKAAWYMFKNKLAYDWNLLWTGTKNTLSLVWSTVSGIFSKPIDSIKTAMSTFKATITSTWSSIWTGMKTKLSNIWSGVSSIFKAPLNAIIKGVNSFTSSLNKIKIPSWVKGVGGKGINIPSIPMLAKGSLNAPDTYIAGEAGPELITGASGSTVYPASETNRLLKAAADPTSIAEPPKGFYSQAAENNASKESTSSERTINININGSGAIQTSGSNADKESILKIMMENIKTVLMELIEKEILEEGDLSYEY